MGVEVKSETLLRELVEVKTMLNMLLAYKKLEARADYERRGKPPEEIDQAMATMFNRYFEFHWQRALQPQRDLDPPDVDLDGLIH